MSGLGGRRMREFLGPVEDRLVGLVGVSLADLPLEFITMGFRPCGYEEVVVSE